MHSANWVSLISLMYIILPTGLNYLLCIHPKEDRKLLFARHCAFWCRKEQTKADCLPSSGWHTVSETEWSFASTKCIYWKHSRGAHQIPNKKRTISRTLIYHLAFCLSLISRLTDLSWESIDKSSDFIHPKRETYQKWNYSLLNIQTTYTKSQLKWQKYDND